MNEIVDTEKQKLRELNGQYVNMLNDIITKAEHGEGEFKLGFLYRLRRKLLDTAENTMVDSIQMNIAKDIINKYNGLDS